MAHQISASDIRPGQNVIIRGLIEYIRVRSLMGPEDIDALNKARNRSRYNLDRNKPLTRLALYNAEVVPQNPSGQMTPEEYYVWERMFETADKPELGRRWNIDNKGNRLPILLKAVDGKAEQIRDEDVPPSSMSMPTEPARDQAVTVVLNVYDSGMGNNGIGIQAIIFSGEPEWFTGGSSVNNNALAALGITLSGPIVAQEGIVATETPAQAVNAAPAAPVVQPAQQVAAPVAAPVAPAVAQPVAPAVPVVPAVQQAAPQNTVVDATSGLAMPAPVTQAVAPAAPVASVAPVVPAATQAAPNPQAAQILNAVAQQQAPVQADPASAFGVTPEAQPQPVAPEASVDSPWAI